MPTTTAIFHGLKTNLLTSSTLAITSVATAVIGLVATGGDADAGAFPLGEPVLIADVRAALARAGTSGTLPVALAAIADQCSPLIVVVRVAVDAQAQDDAVIAGLHALLTAEQVTGYRPRILGAPGLASPAVTAALATLARQLRGMAYALAVGADVAAARAYAATFTARELMLLWPETRVGAGDAEARALALRAAIDATTGWHKTLSNVALSGVTGLAVPVTWSLDGTVSDAALLNNAAITTMVFRNGWRFWGNRTTSADPAWAFESAVRTSQVLQDSIEDACFAFADRPLSVGLVKDIVASANRYFRKLATLGQIVGATCWYDPAANAGADLAAGQLVLDYDFTPAAPLEGLTFNQRLTDRYYVDFATLLQTT